MKLIYWVITIIFFSACTKESPLSDVELNDPSLIQLDISIEKSIDFNGNLNSDIRVNLYDKNQNLIKLKKGHVSVNGNKMQTREMGLHDAPYYTIDSKIEKVEANKTYVFYIELSDGKVYQASIVSQSKDLYKLDLPDTHKMTEDMNIKWKGSDLASDYELELKCKYKKEDTLGEVTNVFIPSQQETKNGLYKIPKTYFNQSEGIYESIVTISSKKKGVFDSKFHPDSEVKSQFSIARLSKIE